MCFEQNCGDETRLRSGQRVGRGVGVRDFGSALEFFVVQSEQGGHRLGVRADDFRRADGTDVAGLTAEPLRSTALRARAVGARARDGVCLTSCSILSSPGARAARPLN